MRVARARRDDLACHPPRGELLPEPPRRSFAGEPLSDIRTGSVGTLNGPVPSTGLFISIWSPGFLWAWRKPEPEDRPRSRRYLVLSEQVDECTACRVRLRLCDVRLPIGARVGLPLRSAPVAL